MLDGAIEGAGDGTADGAPDGAGGEPASYTITELTREFDVSTRTLRFYEDEGLLHPQRRGRTRVFRPADRQLLAHILRGKRLGFSIAEIREIVDMYREPPGEAGQLDLLMARVREKRDALEQKRRDIEATLDGLAEVEAAVERRRGEIAGRGKGVGNGRANGA